MATRTTQVSRKIRLLVQKMITRALRIANKVSFLWRKYIKPRQLIAAFTVEASKLSPRMASPAEG